MTEIKDDIPEIIRLQLRKPTSWGWELSTFKPSRNVTLPTIQLYNYKGQLLVEAKDNGETERSWRSSTMPNKGSAANVEKESGAPGTRHLNRSRSDTLGQNSSANISRNKFESINRKDRNRQPNNKIKSFDVSLDNSATKATADIAEENRGSESKATKVITEIESGTENSHSSLKKSKSDASEQKANLLLQPSIYKRNSFQTFQEFAQKAEARHQRRSKSDEFLRRRLRSSEESVKRAELDGYINFIKPNIPHHKSQDKPNRNKKLLTTAETVLVDNHSSSIAVNDYKPKKYRTRTSSAGTLIISEESFNEAHHRRRRRNVADADQTLMERKSVDVQSSARKSDAGVDTEGLRDGVQLINGSASPISGKYAFNPQATITETPTVEKFSSGTLTTAVNDRPYRDFNSGIQKYNTLEGICNGNRARITKYARHDSDPLNSISRRYAFKGNADIAHSHSSGTLTSGDNNYRSSNRNGHANISRTSSKGKTDLPESFLKNPDVSTKTLGFTKYVRPISDPTSWISRKYAFNSQQRNSDINNQQRLSNGVDNPMHAGVSSASIVKHGRQISDPTSSISRRYLSNRHSSVTKASNENTLSKGIKNTTTAVLPTTAVYPRHISDPTSSISRSYLANRLSNIQKIGNNNALRETDKTTAKQINPGANLFYSLSYVFPFREKVDDKIDANLNDNCNYVVQEPITPSTPSESRKNSEPIIEKLERNERRKVGGRDSDGSASSNAMEKGSRTKGHLIKDHSKHKGSGGGGDTDLLQLVRRLSSTDHVKMGANVSRHSAKGLSGRRSQSSGSICNGKGRHPDGKICSSLPSYLDDRQSNGCNNNHHECEKPPLDEVDRIPPLGDGAPLHWKFSDTQTALCDQGYGSERSPEEEYPPPLPDHDQQCHHHLEPHACYPFITPESTFIVKLTKGTRGLGLSVTGGIDSTGSWPGLIRIKRLFPHQPASACGLLNVGDLLLQANGITLTGLTNYEALEVLRTAPNQVDLKVCRPPPDVLNCVSPISEVPPPPPRREPPCTLNLSSAIYTTPEDDYYHGEFEVTLKKIHGSLGFTLRKEDDSALGHYVRALVREPALTDGRIKAGDKIIAVNDVEISPMSHEQAVQFLRQCSEVVRLRLYRDSAQTPVAALSPSETTPRTSFSRKAHLRQEAVDMLNDIAVRKLIPGNQDIYRRSLSPNASPRRLRRQNCPSDASQVTDSSVKYLINDEQFHEGLLQKCSHPFDDDAFNSLFSIESDEGDKPHRPSSLDLYNPNQTPVATRKPRFNFSLAHNAYELNNLDPEVLDAPNLTYNLGNDDAKGTDVEVGDSFLQEPASMPHIPIDNPTFSYKHPAYQSAHPQIGSDTVDFAAATTSKTNGKLDDATMKKWKNVALQDEIESKSEIDAHQMPMKEEYEVLAIELNRGWNSRLGFSLQGAAGVTYVSAVHADSVAAKDGRLKPGDRVIKVNDESVEHMTTGEIIDLLRIVRGPVCIVVSRVKSNEDCPKSNAEN